MGQPRMPPAPLPTAVQIAADVAAGRRRAVEVCDEALARIDALEPQLRAFLSVTREHALGQAARVDADRAAGVPLGPLAGVPIAIKDNLCTRFGRTTCGSRMLEDYRSPFDATAVARIEAAGGVIVGKTNLDEFAMGSSTENSAFHPTHNPWDVERVPGGSSGGSAAAVAARLVPLALGSDTGGSIRQPAAMCGVVGLKPSYGRVSRYGLVAFGSSLDQIGPLATNVADAALLLGVIAGDDPRDTTCVDAPVPDYRTLLTDDAVAAALRGLRIGVPREYFGDGLDTEVAAAVRAALAVYERCGATLVDVSLAMTPHCIAVYYLVATAEASSNLARFDGVHYGRRAADARDFVALVSRSRSEGFGAEVQRRIMLGTFALSSGYYDAYYTRALRVRRLVQQDFDRAFQQVDLIACPTTPSAAFRIGEKTADPLQMYLADVYTTAANLAGICGVSVPSGRTSAGLPIGLQLLGPLLGEARLLQAAAGFERQTDWHTQTPPLCAAPHPA
ncbi:MAG: Asp-tRNA(Asn)/Glu-tRNA(Gln) amidotransferase subunit GatA [Phycisphaerae bacterium]